MLQIRSLSIPKSIIEKIEKIARKNHRSFSAEVSKRLEDSLRADATTENAPQAVPKQVESLT